MEVLATTISFSIGGLMFVLTITAIPIYLSIARLADNVDSVRHRLDKIIDIFESEKTGSKRSVRK